MLLYLTSELGGTADREGEIKGESTSLRKKEGQGIGEMEVYHYRSKGTGRVCERKDSRLQDVSRREWQA